MVLPDTAPSLQINGWLHSSKDHWFYSSHFGEKKKKKRTRKKEKVGALWYLKKHSGRNQYKLCVKIWLCINYFRNLTCLPTSIEVSTLPDFLNSIKGIFKVKPTFPTFVAQKSGGFVVVAFKARLSQNAFLRHHYPSCSLSLGKKTLEECKRWGKESSVLLLLKRNIKEKHR